MMVFRDFLLLSTTLGPLLHDAGRFWYIPAVEGPVK